MVILSRFLAHVKVFVQNVYFLPFFFKGYWKCFEKPSLACILFSKKLHDYAKNKYLQTTMVIIRERSLMKCTTWGCPRKFPKTSPFFRVEIFEDPTFLG